jgi:pyruvate dehydrogenase E1 component alpha subunit
MDDDVAVTTQAAVSREVAKQMYTTMTIAAACDERLRRAISSGEFAAGMWPSRGQEAIAAGVGAALRRDDRLVTTYRGVHDLVGKGVPLVEIMGEFAGRLAGASHGKSGMMHITAPDYGVMLTTGIVGAGMPVAVGLAIAAQAEGSDRVVSVSFGDGASNTGTFHEAMNLASLWDLPVIFVCQNNQFGEHTATEHTMKIERIADRAIAYAMPGTRIDGNDPEEVYRTIGEAVERGRNGGGPTLVECVTFRLKGHSWGDQQKYIEPERLKAAADADPVPRYRAKLLETEVLSEEELAAIDADAPEQVQRALDEAFQTPAPGMDELNMHLYDDMAGIPS